MKKIIVIGVIALFIGVCSQSVFAVEDKTPTKSSCIDSENEVSINAPDEIYENTDCDVIGLSWDTRTWSYDTPPIGPIMLEGDITFGYEIIYVEDSWASGWIYTKGNSSEWSHRGFFRGYGLGKHYSYEWHEEWEHFIGIKGFKGFAFGPGLLFIRRCFYIGHADTVRIIT